MHSADALIHQRRDFVQTQCQKHLHIYHTLILPSQCTVASSFHMQYISVPSFSKTKAALFRKTLILFWQKGHIHYARFKVFCTGVLVNSLRFLLKKKSRIMRFYVILCLIKIIRWVWEQLYIVFVVTSKKKKKFYRCHAHVSSILDSQLLLVCIKACTRFIPFRSSIISHIFGQSFH